MHPVRLLVRKLGIYRYAGFSRFAGRVPQRPKLRTYFFVNPKRAKPAYRTSLSSYMDRASVEETGKIVLSISRVLPTFTAMAINAGRSIRSTSIRVSGSQMLR